MNTSAELSATIPASFVSRAALAFAVSALATPALAEGETVPETDTPKSEAVPIVAEFTLAETATFAPVGPQQPQGQPQSQAQGQPGAQPGGPPPFAMGKPVFDETWVSLGIGAGLVPSYSGSDDYVFFPLPLIVGRVGGVGLSPNGPGLVLDVNSPKPSLAPPKGRVSFGPAFRIRNDRVIQIEDAVVEQLPELDLAVELGGNIGYTFPGVFKARDALTISTQVRWDVAGAHEGMLIEPGISYRTSLNAGTILQVISNVQFVDDSFAEYYFTVTPAQSAISGLPVFNADGGLNSVGTTAIVNFDVDGNALNGGLNIYVIGGYTRLIGDGADTPFTSIRGNANQFIGGVGLGYTF